MIKTREEAERMKKKAAEFSRHALGDEEKADEFDNMSLDEYAEHKGIALSNPGKVATKMASLRQQISDLQDENDELRQTVEEYEARFSDIEASLPPAEEEEEEEDEGNGD